jgi:integrase
MDTNILSFIAIFEKPKTRRETKLLTSRIIITADIENALASINGDNTLSDERRLNFQTLLLFLSYSGQRTVTASRLTVSQFKEALSRNPNVLTVEARQDKIRLQHYVPLHPMLIELIQSLLANKLDSVVLFDYLGLQRWLRANPIALTHCNGKLQLKDLRKFFEQKSDEIGFNDANKNFIMSHGVSSINWTSYKQFLPENVYKRYMDCWANVVLTNNI